MIQRIQSIFLFVAGIFSVVSCFFLDIWKTAKQWVQTEDYVPLLVLNCLVALSALLALFLFRNRKNQMRFVYLSIVFNVLLVGLLVYYLQELPGGFDSEKGIGLVSPILVLVLLILARNGIRKDEQLVKSVERIR